jgi:hypothetical protein
MVAKSYGGAILHSMMKKQFKVNRFQFVREVAKEYGNLPGLVRGYVHKKRFYLMISPK